MPYNSANMLSTQHDNGVTYVINGPHKCQIDSFDTWLQVWNVYEKLVMASQPTRYAELVVNKFNFLIANFAGRQCTSLTYTPAWLKQTKFNTAANLVWMC